MKDNTSKKYELLIERLCETFGALYQGKVIDRSWLCEKFGVTERTAYRDLARLSHLLEEVSVGATNSADICFPHCILATSPSLPALLALPTSFLITMGDRYVTK
ncbi:hypothetical protein [Pectobacterium punjabense]|uniref:hypothetical protein n=1 Tax=Pectobacterium punjabense TaxID=2108399 RepID=UPI001F0B7DD0|nr:hypothetical protein [Pectobacterium punjabense]